MKQSEFLKRIQENPRPVVIDLWAPWCAPCRAMEPAFEQVGQKYAGQVDVLKINADESPEVLRSLRVMSIPTVIGFAGGEEIIRKIGLQSAEGLAAMFDATLHQRKAEVVIPPAPINRLSRSVVGLTLLALGAFYGPSLLLMALGAIVLFSAFYDRCPIYRAIAPRVASWFRRSS